MWRERPQRGAPALSRLAAAVALAVAVAIVSNSGATCCFVVLDFQAECLCATGASLSLHSPTCVLSPDSHADTSTVGCFAVKGKAFCSIMHM